MSIHKAFAHNRPSRRIKPGASVKFRYPVYTEPSLYDCSADAWIKVIPSVPFIYIGLERFVHRTKPFSSEEVWDMVFLYRGHICTYPWCDTRVAAIKALHRAFKHYA